MWAQYAFAEVRVGLALEQNEVYVGESFVMQIQVEGADKAEEPDLSHLQGFMVEARGGQQNSSQSVSIVNGKMTRVSHHGYIFNYALTPIQQGYLSIPSIEVTVDGKPYRTRPANILAKKPEETDDFKLRLKVEKPKVYVGEAFKLAVTWYIGKDIKDFQMNLPIMSDPRFRVKIDSDTQQRSGDLVRIVVGNQEIIASKSEGNLDGRRFMTVSFDLSLIAKEAGVLTLPQMTISCRAVDGARRNNRRDRFSGFFNDDFFGRGRQVYKSVVVPSNQPSLEVLALPTQGKPKDFSGLVGDYSLVVSASPTEVKVGDPITLNVQLAGPNVEGFGLSFLKEQLGETDFKVPDEMAPGVSEGILKTFTQTVRAKRPEVKQIPSLHVPYFDPQSATYKVARSKTLPLDVEKVRTITALDAEGLASTPSKREIQTVEGGINYNYEGPEVLADQGTKENASIGVAWYLILGVPPLLFFIMFGVLHFKRLHNKDPERRVARKAFANLKQAIKKSKLATEKDIASRYLMLGDGMRQYLGAKLLMNPLAIIYVDVEGRLKESGVSDEALAGLQRVLEHCEAFTYAGGVATNEDFGTMADFAEDVAKKIDKAIIT